MELNNYIPLPMGRPRLDRHHSADSLYRLSSFQLADVVQRDAQGSRRSTRGDVLHASLQDANVLVRDFEVAFGECDLHAEEFLEARNALSRMMPARQETNYHRCLRLIAGVIGASLAPINHVSYERPIQIGSNSTIIADVFCVDDIGNKLFIEAGAVEPDKLICALENSISMVMVLPYAGLKQHHCLGWAFQLNLPQNAQELTQPVMITRADINRAIKGLVPNAVSELN
jgi:hypothetical protein